MPPSQRQIVFTDLPKNGFMYKRTFLEYYTMMDLMTRIGRSKFMMDIYHYTKSTHSLLYKEEFNEVILTTVL